MSARTESAGAKLRAKAARLNLLVADRGHSLTALNLEPKGVSPRDRPLFRAMLTGSLRWHHRFDWMLGELLDRPLKASDKLLGALLRIGLTQLAVLRIPDHAAVSETVAATGLLGLSRARGLVNAVLRRYLRERDALEQRLAAVDQARFSHPAWLIDRIRQDWPDQYAAILEANNELPPMWLRVNRTRTSREAYAETLRNEGLDFETDADRPDAVLLTEPRPVAELPGFAAGLVSVQDVSAQMAAPLLAPAEGCRVLDACAAPGGKTAHILEYCHGSAELLAIDSDQDRLEQIAGTLDRLGHRAELLCADATEPGQWVDGRRFDRILVDAPCSASGVIRRHPDIKLLRRDTDLEALSATQDRMLNALWPLLEPGGMLLYVTCSVLRVENIDVIQRFARRNPDAQPAAFGSKAHFQLLPGDRNGDGFYYACLSRGAGGH